MFHSRLMRVSIILAFSAAICGSSASAMSNAAAFDFFGFKLGMTLDEAKKARPALIVTEAKSGDGTVIGYNGSIDELILRFTSPKLGSKMFFAQQTHVYSSPPDTFTIFTYLRKKYGNPDYSGRDMMRVHAYWGRTQKLGKSLHFDLKVEGMAFGGGYPMILTLEDFDLEKLQFLLTRP